jgi:hypothetical protein
MNWIIFGIVGIIALSFYYVGNPDWTVPKVALTTLSGLSLTIGILSKINSTHGTFY